MVRVDPRRGPAAPLVVVLRFLVASAAGLAALALTLPASCGLMLARSAPDVARQVAPRNALVLSTIATRNLYLGNDIAQLAAVGTDARQALRSSPLETAALRDLAIVDLMEGDDKRAASAFALVGKATRRDYQSHAFLFTDAFEHNDFRTALAEADIVLRQRPDPRGEFLSSFVKMTPHTPMADLIVPMLATRPPWRWAYLVEAGGSNGDPETTYAILARLRNSGSAPSSAELAPYFARATTTADPDALLRQWNTLVFGRTSGSGRLIRDPRFDKLDAPPPFNWTLFNYGSTYAEISPGPDGSGSVLHATFSSPEVQLARQSLALPAGAYRLTGQVYSDGEADQSTIGFRLFCRIDDTGTQLDSINLNPHPGMWVGFSHDFVVPSGCNGQRILIRGGSPDQTRTASYWIDNLEIARR